MTNKLLIVTRDQEVFLEKVKALHLPELQVVAPLTEEGIRKEIETANIGFVNPKLVLPFIDEWKSLKWLQSTFAGVDALMSKPPAHDYILTNVKDTYGLPMAEFVLTYMLMFERKVLENIEWQKERVWEQHAYPILGRKSLGIAGTGSIGQEIARIANVFNMEVIGLSRRGSQKSEFSRVYQEGEAEEFLSLSDYVVSVLPHTNENTGFFDAEKFSYMKVGSVFMNIGRGSAVVDEALVEALNGGNIKAAVLDVFNEEPLSVDSPYWGIENVFLTPHVSGYVTHDRLFTILKDNYQRKSY